MCVKFSQGKSSLIVIPVQSTGEAGTRWLTLPPSLGVGWGRVNVGVSTELTCSGSVVACGRGGPGRCRPGGDGFAAAAHGGLRPVRARDCTGPVGPRD